VHAHGVVDADAVGAGKAGFDYSNGCRCSIPTAGSTSGSNGDNVPKTAFGCGGQNGWHRCCWSEGMFPMALTATAAAAAGALRAAGCCCVWYVPAAGGQGW